LAKSLSSGLGQAAEKLSKSNDPASWIEDNFYIPETRNDPDLRGLMRLQDYQRDAIREALSKDENGLYKYSIIVWSDIKKSAKSSIAAAVVQYGLEHTEWGEYYIIANDLKQADSRVAHYLRRSIQLNADKSTKYSTRGYKITSQNGSFAEAIPIDPSGEAGSNADGIFFSELWGANEEQKHIMWCLDQDSDVLTRKGWKKGVELTRLDEVAVYNYGKIEWEHPRSVFIEHYTGKMHLYEHKNFSLMCTPDHRLYGRYSYAGMKSGRYDTFGVMRSNVLRESGYGYYHPVLTADPVAGEIDIPKYIYIAKTKFKPEKYIPWDKWASFMGLYLTEGSTDTFRGVPCHVKISQLREPHPQRYDRIREILEDVFGDWLNVNKRDGFSIGSTELAKITKKFGTTWQKRIPRTIIESPPDVLEKFLEGFWLGDGSNPIKSGTKTYCCASEGLADDLQEILFRLGYRSSKRPHEKYWRVSQILGSFDVSVSKKSWQEVDYSGKVWCPVVSTGLFIARREGRPFVTGNSEMTLSPTKYGKSFRWVESYAGFIEESKLLYSLYETGVKRGQLLWPDRLYPVTGGAPAPLELYVNRDARMLCLWNTQPRCPWQTPEYYQSESQVLLPNQFARMHRNQWVASEEVFVPVEWYDACFHGSQDWPTYDHKKHPMIIALDAGVSSDNFGLWMGCRHPASSKDVLTQYVQRWKPPIGGKIDFQGTVENPGPERVLRQLVKEYNVIEIAYDPYQLHDMATRLKQEGLAWFRPFGQGNERLLADSQYRALIRDRRFWHRGEPEMREHVMNANASVDEKNDNKLRIVKRNESSKIDLCITASMGSYEILRLNL